MPSTMRFELNDTELAIARLLATVGAPHSNAGIAKELGRSSEYVKNTIVYSYGVLGLDSRLQLALWYIEKYGLPEPRT